ncbi:MAG TPA: zf-HC2 domain-containing protein [Candidatus Binatia bacterium]|nr:zf-HC2 domain-containing protein [Candidatus Binatia bacterium]
MIHLTTHQLSAFLDRELPESSIQLVRRHLDGCAECALRFEAFREQETILDRVLVHDPGEEFFSGLADRVVGPGRKPRVTKSEGARAPMPERVAAAPAAVPAPHAAIRRKASLSASRRPRQQPAIPWFAAAILCLIVGAIGYTIPRPFPRPNPAPAGERPAPPAEPAQHSVVLERQPEPLPKPETTALAPVTAARALETPTRVTPKPSAVPVRRFQTTTSVAPSPVHALPRDWPAVGAPEARTQTMPKPAAIPDELAGAPPAAAPLVAIARRSSQAAAADSSAANLDAAANAWDQAVPALTGAEQAIARRHLAEARYRAWLAAPDAYRAASAIASLRSFIVLSPPSPDRDLAKEELKRIGG